MRFGIRGVMLLTMVSAVGMAAASQFYRASQTGNRFHLFVGMIILCAGPLVIWTAAKVFTIFRGGPRQSKRPIVPDSSDSSTPNQDG